MLKQGRLDALLMPALIIVIASFFGCGQINYWHGVILYHEEHGPSSIVVVKTTSSEIQDHIKDFGYKKIDSFGESPVGLLGAWSGFDQEKIADAVGEKNLDRAADLPGLSAYQKVWDEEKNSRSVMLVFQNGQDYRATEYTTTR